MVSNLGGAASIFIGVDGVTLRADYSVGNGCTAVSNISAIYWSADCCFSPMRAEGASSDGCCSASTRLVAARI